MRTRSHSNHANRSSCNRCDAPKPIDLDLSNASKHEELAADHEVVGGFGSYIYAPGRSVQGPTVQIPYPTVAYGPPSPVSAHSPSPTYGIPFHHGISGATMSGHPVLYAGAAPRTFPGYGIPPGQRYNQQPIQMKKGDWICSCGELNFARRDRCRMCGLPGGDGKHALLRMAAAAAAGASATVVEENDPPQSPVSPKTPSAPPSPRNEPTNPGSAHLMALRQNYAAQPVQQAMPGTYIPMYRHVPGMPLGSQSRTAQVPFAMQTLVMVPTYPGAAGMVAHAGYPPAAYAWPAYGYAAYGPSAPLQHYPIAGMQPLLAAGRPSSEPDDE